MKTEFPYAPAISLLAIRPEKTVLQKDTYTPVFIAALFTRAKTWKQQPEQPSTEEWIRKMQYRASLVAQGKDSGWQCRRHGFNH